MTCKALFGLVLGSIVGLTAEGQTTNHNARALSLKECIEMALARNPDIQVQRYSPQIARYWLRASYGLYDPILTLDGLDTTEKQPGFYDPRKLLQTTATRTNLFSVNTLGYEWPNEYTIAAAGPSVRGVLPIGLSYNVFARSTYYQATTFVITNLLLPQQNLPPAHNNPSSNNWSASAGFTLSQPVLKNSWIDFFRQNIQLNKKSLQISEAVLRGELMTNVTLVARAYYKLILAREAVQVQTSALQSANQLVEDSRRKVQAGALLPLDQQQAESSYQTIQTELFAAEQNYLQEENELKSLLTDNYQSWMDLTIVPSESLDAVVELPGNRAASWANALLRRPDLMELRLELEKQDIIVVFTHNQLFPTLDLGGGYAWASTEHTFSQSLSVLRDGSFPSYSASAIFATPVANIAARNEHKASGLAKEQALLRFKRLQQSIITEVDTAVKLTETTFKQVGSTRKARVAAKAALDSAEKQYRAGALTSFFVLDFQRRLAFARYAEVRALADYHIAQAGLALSEGGVLEKNHIDLKLE